MGNFEQKLAQAKSIDQLQGTLKNLKQTRSDSEIQVTDRLTHLLSDLNSQRISLHKNISAYDLDWSQYVFVCIQGFPATKNQFEALNLPGQTIYFSSISFSEESLKSNQSTKQKLIYLSTFKHEATRINQLLNSIKKRKIILVYHSAGNFMLGMYFFYYGYSISQKIKGIIDISGGPLRYYISAQMLTPIILETDFKQIVQNADKVHKFFLKSISSTGFDLGFHTKYETLSFIHYIKSPDYGEVFASTWNHPNVLKLFIHGRNDTLFNSSLLNQKAIYYTYKKDIPKDYQQKLIQKYVKLYKPKKTPQNLQERFIVAIPKGQHSVHNQQKNHELIRWAVQQYLTIIHE